MLSVVVTGSTALLILYLKLRLWIASFVVVDRRSNGRHVVERACSKSLEGRTDPRPLMPSSTPS